MSIHRESDASITEFFISLLIGCGRTKRHRDPVIASETLAVSDDDAESHAFARKSRTAFPC